MFHKAVIFELAGVRSWNLTEFCRNIWITLYYANDTLEQGFVLGTWPADMFCAGRKYFLSCCFIMIENYYYYLLSNKHCLLMSIIFILGCCTVWCFVCSFETFAHSYNTTRLNSPEDHRYSHRRENFKSYTVCWCQYFAVFNALSDSTAQWRTRNQELGCLLGVDTWRDTCE
jgi:hypothetical protein